MPVVTLGTSGLVVVTHEDAVYVLDKQRVMGAGPLEHMRALLAAAREDLH